jgi:hypothetical protein
MVRYPAGSVEFTRKRKSVAALAADCQKGPPRSASIRARQPIGGMAYG